MTDNGGIMKRLLLVVLILGCTLSVVPNSLAKDAGDLDTAIQLYNSGKFGEAVNYLREYVDQRPDPKGYYLLGYALYKLKRFDEAEEYFNQAYLIDPAFSPEASGLPKSPVKGKRHKSKVHDPAAAVTPPQETIASTDEPSKKESEEPASAAVPAQVKPQQGAQRPPTEQMTQPAPHALPSMPKGMMKSGQSMPGLAPGLLTGVLAGFATFFIVIGIVLYLFTAYCLYRIAQKTNVEAAWTAWIPLLQLWALVASAGKQWWWILLLFVPFVNIIVATYLWICITENLGQNKWLGLLMLLPMINFLFMAYLAFSKPAGGEAPAAPLGDEL
jgi:tetratricopeptide (TPR) repeat protein